MKNFWTLFRYKLKKLETKNRPDNLQKCKLWTMNRRWMLVFGF